MSIGRSRRSSSRRRRRTSLSTAISASGPLSAAASPETNSASDAARVERRSTGGIVAPMRRIAGTDAGGSRPGTDGSGAGLGAVRRSRGRLGGGGAALEKSTPGSSRPRACDAGEGPWPRRGGEVGAYDDDGLGAPRGLDARAARIAPSAGPAADGALGAGSAHRAPRTIWEMRLSRRRTSTPRPSLILMRPARVHSSISALWSR